MKDLILNINGFGFRYVDFEIDEAEFMEMQQFIADKKITWEKLVFDFQYQRKFDLLNRTKILEESETQQGIYLSASTFLEVKQVKGKRIAKTTANSLIEKTLFPIYTIAFENEITKTTSSKQIRVMQEEKGLLAKFYFSTDLFAWENLTFVMLQFQKTTFLSKVQIGNDILISKSNDSVVTGNNVLIL